MKYKKKNHREINLGLRIQIERRKRNNNRIRQNWVMVTSLKELLIWSTGIEKEVKLWKYLHYVVQNNHKI